MKKRLVTLALVLGLALSSVSVAVAANSTTNDRGSSSSSSSSSDSSSSSSSSSSSVSSDTTTAYTNSSGQTYTKTVSNSNGVTFTSTKIGNFTVTEAVQSTSNGVTLKFTQTGVSFDQSMGSPVNLTMFVMTQNGVTAGCFVDPATGKPYATGADTILYAYNTNGELVAHFIDANGFFYTGTRTINGQTVTFNSEGVMVG